MRLFSAVLLALVAALAVISAGVAAFPAETSHRLIWSGLAFPVLWPLFIFYAYWADKPARPAVLFLLLSLASTAAILAR